MKYEKINKRKQEINWIYTVINSYYSDCISNSIFIIPSFMDASSYFYRNIGRNGITFIFCVILNKMKYLVNKAVIYYDESIDNKSSISPNVVVNDIDEYKASLKDLINCDRIYLTYEEVD